MSEHGTHRGRRLRRDRAMAPRRDRPRGRADRRHRRVDPVDAERAAGRRPPGAAPYRRSTAALDRGGFEAALIAVPHHLHEPWRSRRSPPACTCCSRSRSRRRSTPASGSSPRRAPPAPCSWSPRTRSTGPRCSTVRELIDDGAIGDVVTAARRDVLPRARRVLRRRPAVAVRPGGRGRRRRHRHRLALAAAAAHVARRGRRGRRRARPPASRHGGRVAVPRAAALRVGHGRGIRRDARDRRRSRTSRCSP